MTSRWAADPERKVRFREEAREIVFKDRDHRRYGRSVDTAGAIARALERAWREGFEAAQADPVAPPLTTPSTPISDREPMPWRHIPPRPRTAFWMICLWFVGKNDRHVDRGSILVPAATPRGTAGWRLIRDPQRPDHDTMGDRTIQPLIRLGLLEQAGHVDGRLTLTERGRSTWQTFLERGGQYPEDELTSK